MPTALERTPDFSQTFNTNGTQSIKFRERMGFTVRFEAQNALNRVILGGPSTNVTDTNFGYNPHTQKNTPPIAQLSGRFTF